MILSGIALFATALLLGGMVFFAVAIAPLVFTRLPPEWSGRFIRQVFPVYYLWVLGLSAAAAVALLPLRGWDALAMAAVAALGAWLRQGLMPRINRLSDAAQAGDAAAKPPLRRGAPAERDAQRGADPGGAGGAAALRLSGAGGPAPPGFSPPASVPQGRGEAGLGLRRDLLQRHLGRQLDQPQVGLALAGDLEDRELGDHHVHHPARRSAAGCRP